MKVSALRSHLPFPSFALVAALFAANLSIAAPAAEPDFSGERIVSVLDEPRHRTVHKEGDLYLLDVQVNPGDGSLPHTHSSALLVTYISNGAGPVNGRVSVNTDYVKETVTHKISNAGPGLMRIIAMTNLGPGESDVLAGRPQGMQQDPVVENEWFRSYRLRLEPGQESPALVFENPSVVVQVTEGKTHVSRADGITAELDEMAKWAWRDAGSAYRVTNKGSEPVELVINEGRR